MKLNRKLELVTYILKNQGIKSCLNLLGNYLTYNLEPDKVWTEPVYLQIEPTTRCNLKCRMCYANYDRRSCEDLSFDRFRQIVDQFLHVIKIHLQGIGEPFLNKDIFQMIRYAKLKGIKIDLTSNATLIDPITAKEIISSGLDYIEFSIDSPIAQTYEKIRIGAKFGNVINNITNLIKEKTESNKPEIKITAVIMDENIQEMPQLVGFINQLNIKSLFLIHVQPWNKDYFKESYHKKIDFDKKAEEAIVKVKSLAKKLGVYLDISSPIASQKIRACKRPWLSVTILADGYVVPCCRVINPNEINFGNIFQHHFKYLWNSAKYISFRKALKTKTYPSTCNNCYYYYRDPLNRDHI